MNKIYSEGRKTRYGEHDAIEGLIGRAMIRITALSSASALTIESLVAQDLRLAPASVAIGLAGVGLGFHWFLNKKNKVKQGKNKI